MQNFPTVDANRSQEEPWRLSRLERVIGYVFALAEYAGDEYFFEKVESLYDHKGEITITWRKQPSDKQKDFFSKAWFSQIGDGSLSVEHVIKMQID
jgi:hypothetical protein